MSSEEGNVNGKAWVKDGRVMVKDPGPGGKPAVLLPSPYIEVLVSGRKISVAEPVTEASLIQIHFQDQQPIVTYVINVAQGGLDCRVTMQMRDGLTYTLEECQPTESLHLKYKTSPVSAAPDLETLVQALREKGVVHGIDMDVCKAVCAHPTSEPFVAARGEPHTPGQDGSIQFLVPMERIVDLPTDVLQIDFRETVKLPDVKVGQAIAIKRAPVPGTPGMTVTGTEIPAPRCKDPHFRAGKGVEILQDKPGVQTAVATSPGYPRFAEESGVISVEPILIFKGDVDMASGNLRSSGGLNVTGQVKEGMKVECEGDQEVAGAVTAATLKAWGSIRIRGNVFKSTVTAGKDSTWVRTMDVLFKDISEAAQDILALETQIKDIAARKEEGTITDGDKHLLEGDVQIEKFRKMLIALSAVYKENLGLFPKEIADRVRGTREVLSGFGTGIFEKTHSITSVLAETTEWITLELLKGKSDVTLPYAQSSTIEASRDIFISGQGAFYSTLIAGRSVKISGSPGLMRGGEARARELVQVTTAGGHGAAPTLLSVSSGGKIQAQTILPNTVLTVGRQSFSTENTLNMVKASLHDGRLLISSTSGSFEVQ